MSSRLDVWISIFVAATASLGALLLGLGQHTLALATVASFCAVSSAICTDHLQWFHLPKWLAGPLAMAAVFVGFYRFSVAEPGNQLLVIADLLIYLQLVLFFQHKTTNIYWQICLLSLFQVVVSAALNLYVAFGGLVVTYLFLMLGAATLLFCREESNWHRRLSLPRSRAAGGPTRDNKHTITSGVLVYPERRENIDSGVNISLVRYMLRFSILSLVLTSLIFFAFPRFGDSGWQSTSNTTQRLVGYSGDVALNEFGEIHESPEEVMRVYFTDVTTGEPVTINREPYFRGDALTHYRPVRGTWMPRMVMPTLERLEQPPKPSYELVRQTVSLESASQLFSVVPFYRAAPRPSSLRFDGNRNVLVRDAPPGWDHDDQISREKRFEVLTSAFRFGMQRPMTPEPRDSRLSTRELRALTAFDESRFPELNRIAEEVADNLDSKDDVVEISRRLESYLRGTSFSYSLNLTDMPPRGVDPIEYFISTHRNGHCEYFASALALMCRSQRIPARLVVGYRGGEYNSVGQYYLVRELHAHAWVEVYLQPEQVPELSGVDDEPMTSGAWLRLDPTPGTSSAPMPISDASLWGQVGQLKDFVELLWRDYVVGLNADRQRQAIYEPVVGAVVSLFRDALLSREWWSAFGETLSQRLGLGSWDAFRERWLSWKTIPFVGTMLLIGYITYRLGRWCGAALKRLLKRFWKRRPSWTYARQLEFFRRWDRLAKRLNVQRASGETHQERAAKVATKLKALYPDDGVSATADNIVAAFYRVRYGKQKLSLQEVAELEIGVRELWRLAHRKPVPPTTKKT